MGHRALAEALPISSPLPKVTFNALMFVEEETSWLDEELKENIVDVMMQSGSAREDDVIEWEDRETTVGFDLLLDRLSGTTAALLRRERFEKSDIYARNMERVMSTGHGVGTLNENWVLTALEERDQWRWKLMPEEVRERKGRRVWGPMADLYKRTTLTRRHGEKFPDGIPAISSPVWDAMMDIEARHMRYVQSEQAKIMRDHREEMKLLAKNLSVNDDDDDSP